MTLGVCVIILLYIYYYTIIHIHILILYIIISYTILFSSSDLSSSSILCSLPFPSIFLLFLLIQSIRVGTYLRLFISNHSLLSFPIYLPYLLPLPFLFYSSSPIFSSPSSSDLPPILLSFYSLSSYLFILSSSIPLLSLIPIPNLASVLLSSSSPIFLSYSSSLQILPISLSQISDPAQTIGGECRGV